MSKKSTFKACLSLFRIRAAEGLQYRVAALSGVTISVFWALIEVIVFRVFYTYAEHRAAVVNGMSLPQVITYVWIAQCIVPLHAASVDSEILAKINSGDVGVELCRPLSLYAHWFAKTAAGRFNALMIRGTLTYLAGILIPMGFGASLPVSPAAGLVFILSLLSAFFLSASYGMLASAVRLGVTWGDGPIHMISLLSGVFSGAYLPLQLWPDALQPFLLFQPFAGYTDIPARLYVGSMPLAGAPFAIGLQLCWGLLFLLLGNVIMKRKIRNIIVQGG